MYIEDTPSTNPTTLLSIGLLPIDIGRSYGLTLYLPVPLQNYLLTHPDLPVYRDTVQATSKLSSSLRAPSGTSRVFHPSPFLYSRGMYTIAESFRRRIEEIYDVDVDSYHGVTLHSHSKCTYRTIGTGSYSYNNSEDVDEYLSNWAPCLADCISVLDEPIVTDPSSFDPSTFKYFPRLACFSPSIHERLVNDSIHIEDGKTRGIFGLPTITPVRYTKSGAPRRKPGMTIRAKHEAQLELRGSLALPAMKQFVIELNAILFPDEPDAIKNSRYRNYGYFHKYFDDVISFTALDTRRNRRERQTLDDDAHAITNAMNDLYTKLKAFNDWEHGGNKESFYSGPLRTPSIYLRTFHRESTLSALSILQPHLSTLRNYPRCGVPRKISSSDDNYRANVARGLHNELYKLARAMYPGRCDRFMFPLPATTVAQESLS